MATAEERMQILRMIQEGKISAEDGVALLDVLDAGAAKASKPAVPAPSGQPSPPGRGGRWFRVLVTDMTTGKTRVNVRLPVSLVNAGMKMGAKISPQVEGLDPDQLMEFLKSGETGQIVDVINDEEGEHVQVFIE